MIKINQRALGRTLATVSNDNFTIKGNSKQFPNKNEIHPKIT
jgi:hypothetical protein